MTYEYIKLMANDRLLELVGDQSFASRIGILKKLVARTEAEPQSIEAATNLLSQAQELSGRRNTIVHNPWQIYIDFDKNDFVSEIWKHTNPTNRLSEADIEKFSQDAEELAGKLRSALGALTNASTRRAKTHARDA